MFKDNRPVCLWSNIWVCVSKMKRTSTLIKEMCKPIICDELWKPQADSFTEVPAYFWNMAWLLRTTTKKIPRTNLQQAKVGLHFSENSKFDCEPKTRHQVCVIKRTVTCSSPTSETASFKIWHFKKWFFNCTFAKCNNSESQSRKNTTSWRPWDTEHGPRPSSALWHHCDVTPCCGRCEK